MTKDESIIGIMKEHYSPNGCSIPNCDLCSVDSKYGDALLLAVEALEAEIQRNGGCPGPGCFKEESKLGHTPSCIALSRIRSL